MAKATFKLNMHTFEFKLCVQFVIEFYGIPCGFVVTVLTLFAVLTTMCIVIAMTIKTRIPLCYIEP